jgi:hypothetical protein
MLTHILLLPALGASSGTLQKDIFISATENRGPPLVGCLMTNYSSVR